MDRRPALLSLLQELDAASAAADWSVLEALSLSVTKQLPALAARGRWTEPERVVLLQLRKIHAQAFQICSDEKERLGLHLGDMQANKEGWIAYALNDSDPDGNLV